MAGQHGLGRGKKNINLAHEVAAHLRANPGLPYIADGVEWSDDEINALVGPYAEHFWLVNLMEAQLFVFTYRDLVEMPAVTLDRIQHIQTLRAKERGDDPRD